MQAHTNQCIFIFDWASSHTLLEEFDRHEWRKPLCTAATSCVGHTFHIWAIKTSARITWQKLLAHRHRLIVSTAQLQLYINIQLEEVLYVLLYNGSVPIIMHMLGPMPSKQCQGVGDFWNLFSRYCLLSSTHCLMIPSTAKPNPCNQSPTYIDTMFAKANCNAEPCSRTLP